MNYQNNDMLTSPNLSYTSRDFNAIYTELINSIPLLTKSWDPKDENDPGIVLIKLLSMLGDMLSYNLDKAALEAFPRTVLQRANAQQIFRLVGYKMHWYRSAQVNAKLTNSNTFPIYISRYNTFGTQSKDIVYTNTEEIIIPGGTYGDNPYPVKLIQGVPVTPTLKGSIKPSDYNKEWHSGYDYNVQASDIINDRLYLKYPNIDETSITLIDNDETLFAGNEWTLVKNINTVVSADYNNLANRVDATKESNLNMSATMAKVFEFDVDEDGVPFIQFPSYWKEKFVITKFKLFLVLSNGRDGEIEENILTDISQDKCYVESDNIDVSQALDLVQVFNDASSYGYGPQTCTEARLDAENYINTIDTLVVLKDFEKAVMRMDSVANVIATDIQLDPYPEEMTEDNQTNLYIVRKSDYNNYGSETIYQTETDEESTADELFKENVVGELSSYKVLPSNIKVFLENYIDWIDWSVTGQIFLRKPINADQNYDLMVRINNNLKNRFNCETLDFNEPINYMDVIECIMKTDKNIYHVDLDTASIQYTKARRSLKGNPTGFVVKDKFMIYNEAGEYTGYYATSLGCSSQEINTIAQFDDTYANIYDESESMPSYLAGTGASDLNLTTKSINKGSTDEINVTEGGHNITPGGDGYGKNAGNHIIREDGVDYVIGLFDVNEPREYEIYNKRIYDWTGLNPIFTGKVINTETFTIQEYDVNDNLVDTGYKIVFDSRLYLPDGSDSGQYFESGYRQIDKLCNISDDDKLTNEEIKQLSPTMIADLLAQNKLREVWIIMNREYKEATDEVIDKLTGEMFRQRGDYWYTMRRMYNSETGEILDTYGPILYDSEYGVIRDPACREDVSCEYIQYMDINEDQTDFGFYLGQDANGNALLDSAGNKIEAYPIRPYSLYIYIDGDVEVLADTGSGQINGTPGLLNGHGNIDYSTGYVSFKLNTVPSSMKIMYKINKFTYARYSDFDTAKFFVRPEYIRSDIRK